MTDPKGYLLQSSAGYACRILDKAMDAVGPGTDRTEPMLCLIRRARGLLAAIEDLPKEALATPGCNTPQGD